MIKINTKNNLYNSLTLNEIEWIPCTTFSAVNLTEITKKNNITFPQLHNDPEQIAKIASISHEYCGFESIALPFDLCFEAEALGCTVKLKETNTKEIIDTPFTQMEYIEIPEDFTNNARFPTLEKATKILTDNYNEEIPIIGSIVGPFTLLGQIYYEGLEGVIKQLNTNIVDVEDALYSITTGLMEEIKFYDEIGIDIIAIYEPNATQSILEPHLFKKILKPFLEELANYSKTPTVLHICGDITSTLKEVLTCGFEGISIAEKVDITYAKQIQAELNTKTRICGNISTNETLFRKTPKEIYNETLNILGKGIDILSPGCMISPNTQLKNIQAMIKARNDFCDL
ncbi:uroporphyrinogen decarboxylase family protein [Methanosphaera sp. ISO3-F5]|uniref:uroporphyrinogen decarboxylase family protein n=1 Tax=Methanosphaera sp. ISO3-F5 TaxID=1452353 RepID=UPI002B25E07F|nr:uroporphyrinogen decarboxylase family protein [Methanosphaera sp. ISO3-F5]WQH65044.1 uroporphyrinogen decarboxylase family protein [Methanosphaera sp. ISO3-F5]